MPLYTYSFLPKRTGATFRPLTQTERNAAFFNPFQAWAEWCYADGFDDWWWKLCYFFTGDFEFNKTEIPPDSSSPQVAKKISHVGLLDWLLLLPVLLKAAHYFSEPNTTAWRVTRFFAKLFDSISYCIITLPILYILQPLLWPCFWLYDKTICQSRREQLKKEVLSMKIIPVPNKSQAFIVKELAKLEKIPNLTEWYPDNEKELNSLLNEKNAHRDDRLVHTVLHSLNGKELSKMGFPQLGWSKGVYGLFYFYNRIAVHTDEDETYYYSSLKRYRDDMPFALFIPNTSQPNILALLEQHNIFCFQELSVDSMSMIQQEMSRDKDRVIKEMQEANEQLRGTGEEAISFARLQVEFAQKTKEERERAFAEANAKAEEDFKAMGGEPFRPDGMEELANSKRNLPKVDFFPLKSFSPTI